MEKKKQRIKCKGHYRTVERDEKGKFVKVEKWSSDKRYKKFHNKIDGMTFRVRLRSEKTET